MAGSVRYDFSTSSPEDLGFTGNYPNGQRGSYPRPSFDRSGSFRESSEGRISISGASTPRASSSPVGDLSSTPLTQCLLLDPITLGDQRFPRSGELRRALGISLGSGAEDNSFGAAHSKPLAPVAIEELKRIRTSIVDSASKARNRTKWLNESLLRLNKYCEASNFKKQHRNEVLMNEKSGGSNFIKMGTPSHRNPSDLAAQRFEDRAKNTVLNKRVRSSVAEPRADGRNNTLPRQPLTAGKDRDVPRDGGEGSEIAEEKVRRLPAGGEGWDRKMKRKRSVGTVLSRHADNEGEGKPVIHHKFSNESGLQSIDAQGSRSGSFNGNAGINRLEGALSPATATARTFVKTEPGKVSSTRDFVAGMNKERIVAKANNKISNMEDNHAVSPSPIIKGKASRAPRTGSVMAVNSSPNLSRASGVFDDKQQPTTVNKLNSVGGTNNRKRSIPADSSSPMAWGGQRPPKFSRTRRANVVSPITSHDEVQMPPEGGTSTGLATRVASVAINGILLSKDIPNGIRTKHENVLSPTRLLENEESGAGVREGGTKEKGIGTAGVEERSLNQNAIPALLLTKKSKVLNKEDAGDGARRQGRTGRVASTSRAIISPMRDKLDNPASTKPLKNARIVSDKSGSKSGRPPLKKISDRKAFTRLGQAPASGSPDFTGESDDDREELLEAANFACNASYFACSGPFWKQMEPVFCSSHGEDLSYLKKQLKSQEELLESLSEAFCCGNNNMGGILQEEDIQPHLVSEEIKRNLQGQVLPKQLAVTTDLVHGNLENGTLYGNAQKVNKATPLYQRVLSALIMEDEPEQFGENGGNISFLHDKDDYPGGSSLPIGYEAGKTDGIDFDYISMLGLQSPDQSVIGSFPCNGSSKFNMTTGSLGGHGDVPSKFGMFSAHSESDGKTTTQANNSSVFALNFQYDQLCLEDKILMELQNVGICPETVPDLADGEDEAIGQEIGELQKRLEQQLSRKKTRLDNLIKAVEKASEMEGRSLELVAMDRLVEFAYKKQLATRGSIASKLGVPKVSKQVALSFTKRTLARCKKLDDTGKSCFSEPALRDVILAAPSRENDSTESNFVQDPLPSGSFPSGAVRHDLSNGKFANGASDAFGHTCDQDFAKTGPIINRGKKKEVLLDDVGGHASLRGTSSLGNTLLSGAKGKRSERERDKGTLARNPVTKAGRASQNKMKGEHKPKSKPKQKTASVSTPGDGSNKFKQSVNNQKKEAGVTSQGHSPLESAKGNRENANVADMQDLETMDTDFGGAQDLNSLFDGIPDNELGHTDSLPMVGLDIPMDDLSFMFC